MLTGTLPTRASLVWANETVGEGVHEVVIMGNGWLRVTWTTGVVTHVSPAAVKVVTGKGVSYGA